MRLAQLLETGGRLPQMQFLTHGRRAVPVRSAIALVAALSIATLAMPLFHVAACSCAMLGTPDESIAAAEVAFVGTVVGAGEGGEDRGLGMGTVRYTFDVERASVPAGTTAEVSSLDDPGGAACGFSFGVGERWLVMAGMQDGRLQTNLCSGNVLLSELDDRAVEGILAALPNVPDPPAGEAASPAPSFPIPVVVGGLAALALIAVMVFAFRGDRLR